MSTEGQGNGGNAVAKAERQRFPQQEIVIEMTPPNNRTMLFKFNSEKLRGRWTMAALAGRAPGTAISKMPDLPGMHIALDCNKRTVRIYDPLAEPANKAILEQAKAVLNDVFSENRKAVDPVVREKLTDNDLKSILWEFAEWDAAKKVTLRKGQIPTREEVNLMPGKRRINQFDSNPTAPRYEGDLDMRNPQVVSMGSGANS